MRAHNCASSQGLTLVELLVAMALSSIVVMLLAQVYRNTLDTYNLQTQTSASQQRTHYVATMLQDAFLQVGADLPDSGLAVVQMASACDDSVALKVNPRGGYHLFTDSVYCAGTKRIAVSDARGFVKRDSRSLVLVKRFRDHSLPVALLSINESVNSGNFRQGVDTVSDSIALSSIVNFGRDDALYAYVTDYYTLRGGALCRNGDTLAEDIDSVAFCFCDSTGTVTNQWDLMRSARIAVRGVTSGRHRGYKGSPDQRPRLLLEKTFRLRNRL